MSQTQQFKRQKRARFKNRQRFPRPSSGGGGGGNGEVWIDYQRLPADLDESALDALEESLEAPKKRTKPKPTSVSELIDLQLSELHEIGEKEKVEHSEGSSREDWIHAILANRLRQRIPVVATGCLDLNRDGHAFLRNPSKGYLPTPADVFVPPSLVKRYSLVKGMTLEGRLRPPLENEKYLALAYLDRIDLHEPEAAAKRQPFKELVPLYPEQRIVLEGTVENPLEMRIVDLITPIGRGQRGLIVAPPRTGKTILLQMLAKSIVEKASDAHLIILLIDERPEEVTDFKRMIPEGRREVVSSTFDEPAWRHIQVAEMVIHKARCLVEAGEDVVILLDSITRLARACNIEAPSNGKLLSGGMEASALQFPKRFFGAARKLEKGGSLTILGTALIETGSKMDEVIFEEFKGTGNMELVLDRRLSDRRIFPAIDINRSGTRKEELLFNSEEIRRVWMLRKVLNELDPVEAMEMLIQKMRKTKVNGEFLLTIGS
jgi:transcription termination factor Rho